MLASLVAFSLQSLTVSGVFSDHMVLQRERWVPIWGWAIAGERVWAQGSWGAEAQTKAGPDGKWMLKLKTGPAGGPYTITVGGIGQKVEFRDVLLGEVWLCGGQSNMEWPVGNIGYNPPIENADQEVAAANYPNIRLLQVPRYSAAQPVVNIDLEWTPCSPDTVKTFSATGYFFGLELYKKLGIPIGLISSNIGGTEVELWMKDSALRAVPGLNDRVERAIEMEKDYERGAAKARALGRVGEAYAVIEGERASGWTSIEGPRSYDAIGLGSFDGVVWYRAEFNLPSPAAARLVLGAIDDEDRTLVNGELVGETSSWSSVREYNLPATALKAGRNVVVIRCLDGQGFGGFVAASKPTVWVGNSEVPLTGWAYKQGQAASQLPPMPPRPPRHSDLYNAMIAPLAPYGIRGAIWYQGEANVGRAAQYALSFPAMIENWRQDFDNSRMPFYFVQIAPWAPYGGSGAAAELREAQRLTLRLPNTGMVVTTDITPNFNDIHPAKKREVGTRLANLALVGTYGMHGLAYSGPMYRSVIFENGKGTLRFRFADGLTSRGSDLTGFTIAGEDRVFRPATARIEGSTIVVWSEQVPKPVAVRYGWSSAPSLNLFNSAGLPASPFRTDKWPFETAKASW